MNITSSTPITLTSSVSNVAFDTISTFNPDTCTTCTGSFTIDPDMYSHLIIKPETKKEEKEKKEEKISYPHPFKKVKEIIPNKIYQFEFVDGYKTKTICDDSDTFSLEYAFFLALAKYLRHDIYTFEGILKQAEEFSYTKRHIKLVKKAIKIFKKEQQEELDRKAKELEQKSRNRRRNEYRRKKNLKAKEEYKQLLIEAIKEANEQNN